MNLPPKVYFKNIYGYVNSGSSTKHGHTCAMGLRSGEYGIPFSFLIHTEKEYEKCHSELFFFLLRKTSSCPDKLKERFWFLCLCVKERGYKKCHFIIMVYPFSDPLRTSFCALDFVIINVILPFKWLCRAKIVGIYTSGVSALLLQLLESMDGLCTVSFTIPTNEPAVIFYLRIQLLNHFNDMLFTFLRNDYGGWKLVLFSLRMRNRSSFVFFAACFIGYYSLRYTAVSCISPYMSALLVSPIVFACFQISHRVFPKKIYYRLFDCEKFKL